MSIVRSHLFPHIAFVSILALIAFFGFSRLRTRMTETRQSRTKSFKLWTSIQQCKALDEKITDCKDLISPDAWVDILDLIEKYEEVSKDLDKAIPDFESIDGQDEELRRLTLLDIQIKELLANHARDPSTLEDRTQLRPRLFFLGSAIKELEGEASDQFNALNKSMQESENQFGRDAMVTFVMLLALSLGYLYVVNWLLAKPIRNLAETARAVTEGKLTARADADFDGPVSQLSKDFNNMVDILVTSLAEEARVVRQLKVRTRELQQANEHKSRFLANISHELKTPLNAVIGFADILLAGQHGELSERQQDYLNRIFKAGTHLLSMISELIDLAKLDLGALNLANESCDICTVCKEASEMLHPQLEAKKHKFELKCPENADPVDVDPRRLKQILINLIGNAIKFTPDNGTITLSVAVVDRLVIKVIDTGIGISKVDQKRIFQDFVQLDSALHRHHEGTGIGLTLTRRLVELMKGTLALESALHKGSTFTVTLPVRDSSEADEPAGTPEETTDSPKDGETEPEETADSSKSTEAVPDETEEPAEESAESDQESDSDAESESSDTDESKDEGKDES